MTTFPLWRFLKSILKKKKFYEHKIYDKDFD